jgi:hypothetical protein
MQTDMGGMAGERTCVELICKTGILIGSVKGKGGDMERLRNVFQDRS